MKTHEAEVCIDGVWCCEPVVILRDIKNVNVTAERALFESINKVPNGVFWAVNHYNFTQGTDQTTWMLFNNKWFGWLECAQSRADQANQIMSDKGIEE